MTEDLARSFPDAADRVAAGADATEQARALVGLMTPEERLWCLDGDVPFWAGMIDLAQGGYHLRTFPAAAVPRLGIPGFEFSDGPRGAVIGPATCFPVSMARGATFDPELEELIGEVIGLELRVSGATLYGGVCVNLLRHPGWGRAQETYGEDPHHIGEMGAALARGAQRHVMACVKHFALNSMENTRFKVDVTAGERALHEVYLPHFRRVVDDGVATVMSAYNSVNGEWCGESHTLLTDVLRDEWGFEGFVISDWIFGLRDGPVSVRGGLDVEMPYRMVRAHSLSAALEEGFLGWNEVDAAVTRIVATLLRFEPLRQASPPPFGVLAEPQHRALARRAATRSMVLLLNEPVLGQPLLPLDASGLARVAVLGHLAAMPNLGDGGSSDVMAPSPVTPLDGLRAALPGVSVNHLDGSDLDAASALAAGADVAIVVVGYTKADEGEYIAPEGTSHLRGLLPGEDDPALAEAFRAGIADPDPRLVDALPKEVGERSFSAGGDRRSLRLRAEDEALVHAAAAANPRTVVAVMSGSAVVMEAWRSRVPAVLMMWYPGIEGGHALADVLLGREEPGGRLPFAVPTDEAHLPEFDPDAVEVIYDMWHGQWMLDRDGNAPAYPFGFGLGYTTFACSDLSVQATGPELVVTVTLTNTGARAGGDVVQVYAGLPGSAFERPARRLVGFQRVDLAAGQSRNVTIRCSLRTLAVRRAGTWHHEEGSYEIVVARHAGDPDALTTTVEA